jgi:hypothetical protein
VLPPGFHPWIGDADDDDDEQRIHCRVVKCTCGLIYDQDSPGCGCVPRCCPRPVPVLEYFTEAVKTAVGEKFFKKQKFKEKMRCGPNGGALCDCPLFSVEEIQRWNDDFYARRDGVNQFWKLIVYVRHAAALCERLWREVQDRRGAGAAVDDDDAGTLRLLALGRSRIRGADARLHRVAEYRAGVQVDDDDKKTRPALEKNLREEKVKLAAVRVHFEDPPGGAAAA